MAENQTAAEDSGQQSTQHQTHPHNNQQQQQHQQQHSHNDNSQTLSTQNSEEISSALASPTTPPNENNSASSPDEPQTIVIANHHQQQQNNQAQQQTRSMIDRQVTTKIKTIRRNTIQTTTMPVRATSTTSIKKTSLTKMNSLTGTGNVEKNTTTTTEKHHMQQQQQQHHHHHHQHNSMTNHHHHHHHNHQNNSSPTTGNNSNSTAIHRTTSESLRLNAIPPSSGSNAAAGGGSTGGDILSNATSNSSIHSNLTNNSSSSASVAPKSTSTNASHSKSTTSKSSSASSKATSPNNNNSIASATATATSSHASRSHHSHGHIPGHGHGHVAGSVRKPKTTSSFQITSVTVGHQKAQVSASDNGEEESADDLDESHTDDNSRITDLENETPSMSEDTFSKEEIYYHQDDALSSTAPVIPTSSQYGLVVTTLGAQDISNVQVNVGENFINVVPSSSSMKKEDLKDSAQHRSERFKVVKIESTEPFRRGRWVCMDYLDHTSVSGKEDGGSGAAGNNNDKTEIAGTVDNGEHAPKTTQSMILGPGAATAKENHIDPSSVPTADGNWNFPDTTGNLGGGTSTAPATVMHGIQQYVETTEGNDHQTQIMQQEPQYQTPPQEVNANATPQMTMTTQAPPDVVPMDYATVAAQKLKKSLEELKKQEEAIAASEKAAAAAGGVYMPGQSQPVNFEAMQQQQVPIQQTQQVALQHQQQQHASTLPGNINIQNGNISIATDNNNVVQPSQHQTHSLGYSVETTQQPMSPAPQQIQIPPSFVTASFQGTPQQTPPQQSPQMPEAGQTMQQQSQQHVNTQQMQQAPPQQPAPTQLQQQTSQTDGLTNVQNTAALNNMKQFQQQQQQTHGQAVQQQLPPQFQQLQQQQQPLVPGQTMPLLTQMTSYEIQQQQQHQLQHQQSAPATMLDNSALLASLQQQQQQQQSSTTNTMPGSTNIIMQPATASAPSQYQQQNQQQPQLPIDSAPPTSVSANSSNSTVNLNPISTATMIPINSSITPLTTTNVVSSNNNNIATPNIDNQTIMQQQQQMQPPQQQPQQPSTSSQIQNTQQQLQQNTETETESRNVSSLSHAMSTNNHMNQANNRKRAFSTPYITAYDQQMLMNSAAGSDASQFLAMPSSSSMGGHNEQNVYFYNKSSSGRSSFCVDESMWPTGHASRFINNNPPLMQQLGSDSNIYTNLALGNERYKLPVEFTTSLSPGVSITTKRGTEIDDDMDDLVNENEDDLEESTDQFSPLLYPATQQRSQPIAISAGNSPVHKPKSATTRHLTSGQKSPKRNPSPTAGNPRQHMAFSASPTGGVFPYSPFYGGSPDTTQTNIAAQKVSFSYDPSFGANIHHLPLPQGQQQPQQQQQQQQNQPQQQPKQLPRQPPLPQQRHSQPSTGSQLNSPIQTTQRFSTGSIESAPGAILFASSPTSSLTNSASGTSAVAIDNKIEQAMDLVKSHLMIAVREEVEVLKEKISELMDKITQLELENTLLKANVPQEKLQQLQITGTTSTSGSNMITGAPTSAAIAAAPTAPAVAAAVSNPAVSASSNSSTAAATPQSNVGSGTATPTTQQPTVVSAGAAEQSSEATQIMNVATTDDSQGSVQATKGPMS